MNTNIGFSTDDNKQDKMDIDDALKNGTTENKEKGYEIERDDDDLSGYNEDNESEKSSREKTPMCLVNDLARYNKILFQYRLTGEKGPAHCKQFTVTLELGDEVYTAEGFKIKKAQHLAAKEAIQKTKYKHPVPKVNRRHEEQGTSRANVTPTVELNAIAMKLGQPTFYELDPMDKSLYESFTTGGTFEAMQLQRYRVGHTHGHNGHFKSLLLSEQTHIQNFSGHYFPNVIRNPAFIHMYQGSNGRRKFQQCYPVEPPPQHINVSPLPPCKITLFVGSQKFYGVGKTLQLAKHDAAAKAIVKLKQQTVVEKSETVVENVDENGNKSPISLVFEIGIKRNLTVNFKILREEGPAHMRKFITACMVGDIVTEGEGTGKKASKKKAAQKMIEELNKLPPMSPVNVPTKRVKGKTPSKKSLTSPNKNSSPHQMPKQRAEYLPKPESDYENPVAKLLEWCEHNHYSEPIFRLVGERGKDRARRGLFVMEVKSNDITVQGSGKTKKAAKHNAAQNFLLAVTSKATENPSDTAECGQSEVSSPGERIVSLKSYRKTPLAECRLKIIKQAETAENNAVPAPDETARVLTNNEDSSEKNANKNVNESLGAVVTVDKNSHTNTKSDERPKGLQAKVITAKSKRFHMKDKLMYLAKLIGFEVDFSDYPKGNHNEFLTILMISTNPPQICHGVGINAEESQEDASKNALKILSEMGLNNSMK